MPVEWTDARIYKLISSYAKHECLWKYDSDSFSNFEAQHNAYLNIVRNVNVRDLTVNEVRDKIKKILQIYRDELCKINEANYRGLLYEPKTTWFELVHEVFRPQNEVDEAPICTQSWQEPTKHGRDQFNRSVEHPLAIPQSRLSNEHYFQSQQNLDTRPTKLGKHSDFSQAKIKQPQRVICSQQIIRPLQHLTSQVPQITEVTMSQRSSVPGDCSQAKTTTVETAIAPSTKKAKSQKTCGDEFDVFGNSLKRWDVRCYENYPNETFIHDLGKSVACQLRKLSLHDALHAQLKIQSLLIEERINSSDHKSNRVLQKVPRRTRRNRDHRRSRLVRCSRSSNFQCLSTSDSSVSEIPKESKKPKHNANKLSAKEHY